MDIFLDKLTNFGALGLIAALLVYDVFYLQKKLISVIENNTKAMTELKEHCKEKNESKK